MKSIAISALVVALTSGTALADRRRWSSSDSNSRTWGDASRTWSGGVRVQPTHGRWTASEGRRSHYKVAHRPIFVRAPIIRQRYFDVRYRPQIVVENYAPMAGYYWVNGRWDWSGVEWQWTAGHYEPDLSYAEPSYTPTYEPSYTPTYAPSYTPTYAPNEPSCDHDRY